MLKIYLQEPQQESGTVSPLIDKLSATDKCVAVSVLPDKINRDDITVISVNVYPQVIIVSGILLFLFRLQIVEIKGGNAINGLVYE